MDQSSEGLPNLVGVSQEPDWSVSVDINLVLLTHFDSYLTIAMVMHTLDQTMSGKTSAVSVHICTNMRKTTVQSPVSGLTFMY